MILCAGCAGQKQYRLQPVITEERDSKSIPKPKPNKVSIYEDAIENIFGREIDEYSNLSWHTRRLTNNHKQAKNTNALDEVPNSTWFTNRHTRTRMTRDELQKGPNTGSGPDLNGPLTIVAAKVEGVSPGCRIRDQKGDVYFVKFDIKGYPELATSAEVISTKFTYAAGYNTPENYLSVLDPKNLKIADGVMVKNRWGREVPMTIEFVEKLLSKAHSNADGTYRIVASKALSGKPLGPFLYGSRRKDDPNDRVHHHHRRELRGYGVLAAWLNNYDTKANNTLDMYVTENERSFVKHYMIDFGTSLGSGGYGVSARNRGHVGAFDMGNMLTKILTLGLYVEPWEKEPRVISPAVGYFESRLFDPDDYAFIIPNPAFQHLTEIDGFWGAKTVMSFSDDDIRTIVQTGELSNKEDEAYLIKTLIERRDKTGRCWYGKVNPLDRFHFVGAAGGLALQFDDLAVDAGFESKENTSYRYTVQFRGKNIGENIIPKNQTAIRFDSNLTANLESFFKKNPNLKEEEKVFNFRIQTGRNTSSPSGKYVKVYFYYSPGAEQSPQIVALERKD
ncbi:MAG TPA: hypothetical protein VGA99_14025 [bacterium]